MFGQYIPIGGWEQNMDKGRQYTYRTMKTQDMKETRQEEIKSLDDTAQYELSRHLLLQFNQIKKILLNFTFKNRSQNILSSNINYNLMDELRKERKIKMVIDDVNVDEYISMDMTEVDMDDLESHKNLEPDVKYAIQSKLGFRNEFADKISISKLNYIFQVLRWRFGNKAILSDPDAFKDKVRQMEKLDR